jgi:hypothetical protein
METFIWIGVVVVAAQALHTFAEGSIAESMMTACFDGSGMQDNSARRSGGYQ